MVHLAFHVQNFKDISTLIVKNLRSISASEAEGQEIIRNIDDIGLHGSELVNESNVRITCKRNAEFYIELTTDQLDTSDRPAKIGVYGKQPSLSWEYGFEDWVIDTIDEIKVFSTKVDRPVKQEQLRIVRAGLKSIYYEQKRRKLLLLIVNLVLGFIIPILIGLLLQLFPTIDLKTTLISSFFVSVNNLFLILLMQEKI